MWLEEQGCHDSVKRAWKAISSKPPMSRVIQNVDSCKTQLKVWSKKEFCNVVNTLKEKKKDFEESKRGGSEWRKYRVFSSIKR